MNQQPNPVSPPPIVMTIAYNVANGQLQMDGVPCETQQLKDLTIKILTTAIQAVIDFRPSPLIRPKPGMVVPLNPKANGKAHTSNLDDVIGPPIPPKPETPSQES